MAIKDLYEEKELALQAAISNAARDLEELKAMKNKSAGKQGIEKWLDFKFESSSGKTPEYLAFAKDFRRELKKKLNKHFEMLPKTGDAHFGLSGFVRNIETGKVAYWSISDIRYWQNAWYNDILIRTAKHDKDWTGGGNNSSDWPGLLKALLKIT